MISIIVPTLNEARIIANTLRALQPLRGRGHEIIIADGGSTDGTADIATPFVDHIVQSEPGRARQMNAGARHTRGDVLLFLHADTCLPEASAESIEHGLRETQRQWGRFDVRLSGAHPLLRIVERMMNLRSRLTGIATGDQVMFIERALFERTGGFPDLELMEDIALSRLLKRHGRPLCLRARVTTSSRRWERNGVLRTILLMWRLRLAYFFGADPARLARIYYRA